ncbi:MAG: hypothetical protein AB1466_04285 [Actinomycetota bacterium]
MRKIFGNAKDFYRARIVRIEEETPPDFDWREDILYRSPPKYRGKVQIRYDVEIVGMDSGATHLVKSCKIREKAESELEKVEEDLEDLTKMQFERKYKLE